MTKPSDATPVKLLQFDNSYRDHTEKFGFFRDGKQFIFTIANHTEALNTCVSFHLNADELFYLCMQSLMVLMRKK